MLLKLWLTFQQRYEAYSKSSDFINRYIFPGGHLPSVTQMLSSAASGSSNRLIPNAIRNIGPHYCKTLRLWREKFLMNFEERIRPAFLDEHEGMTEKDISLFKRKWEYYFSYCEAGFRECSISDVIVTFARENALELREDVPL